MSNSTSSSSPSAAAGITGALPDSLNLKIEISIFAALASYNSIELMILIFLTFKQYRGLYFWSLLICSACLLPYTVGFLVKYYGNTSAWVGCLLLTIGWWGMVTGQSVVLWSRLHLVVDGHRGEQILTWTAWMIGVDALVFHIPTTVLTWLDNYSPHPEKYIRVFNVFEKLQMTGFFVQEMILSSIYIVATSRILRTSLQDNTRKLLYQLVAINVIIMAGDISLLGIEYGNLYIQETMWKPVLYSLKLKLEFAVLSKLIKFAGGGGTQSADYGRKSTAFVTERKGSSPLADGDVSDFVDVNKVASDTSHASHMGRRQKSPTHVNSDEELGMRFGRFQHVEDSESGGHHAAVSGRDNTPNGDGVELKDVEPEREDSAVALYHDQLRL